MRIIIFLLLVFLLGQPVLSQTKKEMQEQMLQTVNDLKKQIADLEKDIATAKDNKEDANTIKEMEKELAQLKQQLALIQSVNKGISGMSDKTIQQASADEGEAGLPKKDVARINEIPKKILFDAELVSYIKNIKVEVEKKLPAADKTKGEEIYNLIKTKKEYSSSTSLGNVASACWMNGYPEMALYIMGKVCMSDMSNGNNLNNYAAFLTMAGGEHAALPILQNLNLKYPGNSTILNNIGQAWFGLGEMNNANKYLDSSMHFYANHSQANQTKSKIQKAEGNTQGAIESVKRSIRESYTDEKEAQLEKLGGKLENDDIPWKPGPAETLGIEKFILQIPEYPMTVEDAVPRNLEWIEFRDNLTAALDKLDPIIADLKTKAEAYKKKLLDPQQGPELMKPYNNGIVRTATRKMLLLGEWLTDQEVRMNEKFQAFGVSIEAWKNKYDKIVEMVSLANPTTDDEQKRLCQLRRDAGVEYMSQSNILLHQLNNEGLILQKEYINTATSLELYSSPGRPIYEWLIAVEKAKFLSALRGLQYIYVTIGDCTPTEEKQTPAKELPDFDEVNCSNHDEIFIPPFTTMKFECNKWTTEIGVELNFNYGAKISPYLKFEIEENLKTGRTTKGTVEIGGEMGISEVEVGPLKAEAIVKGGLGIEITKHGVESVFAKAGAGMNYVSNPEHADVTNYGQISAQAEGRMTLESGSEKIGGESETSRVHFSTSAEVKGPLVDIKIGGGH